jgi:hypothetical protein
MAEVTEQSAGLPLMPNEAAKSSGALPIAVFSFLPLAIGFGIAVASLKQEHRQITQTKNLLKLYLAVL